MIPAVRCNSRNLFGELSRDMDRLFGQVLSNTGNPAALPVDIREEGDVIVLEADVPGVTREQLDITVENGTLSVQVNREPAKAENQSYVVRERRAGQFSRTFRLPDTTDLDRVEAGLANGVLTLRVPKKEEAKPRQIQVK